MTTTPRLGATELVEGQALPETTVNEQVRTLEQGAGAFAFLDRNLSTDASLTPSDGDCYLVSGTGAGGWTGHDDEIAFYVNTGWLFIAPAEGMVAWVCDEDLLIVYDGDDWIAYSAGGGSGLLTFADTIDCSTNPNYPSATKCEAYLVIAAGKIGGASGKDVGVGDLVIATADNAGGDEATVGTSWDVLASTYDGLLLAENNLSDVASAAAARTNLGLGTAAEYDAVDEDDMASDSNIKVPTQQSVKAYVDSITGGSATFKGALDCSADPEYPAATAGDVYFVSAAGAIGGADGPVVHRGDILRCIVSDDAGTHAEVGTSWSVLKHYPLRYVSGIDCSTNPNYPVGHAGTIYIVSSAGKIGGASGKDVEVGDWVVCLNNNDGGDEATVGSLWVVLAISAASIPATHHAQEWAPNFTDAGDVYIPADEAMTIAQGNAAIGTGTLAFEKSTAAAPSTFSSTSLPADLEAGAWLKVSATGVTGFVATHLVRSA